MTIQQDFWRNPRKSEDLILPDNYIEYCKPEYYIYLQPVSEYVVKTLRKWSWQPIEDMCVFEIGCNSGRNLSALKKAGFGHVAGLEINPECVKIAQEYFPNIAQSIVVGSIEEKLHTLPYRMDIIFTQGVLMHIPHETINHVATSMVLKKRHGMIITIEVEHAEWRNVKFARNYGDIFTSFGMKQLHVKESIGVPYIGMSTLRVFSNID